MNIDMKSFTDHVAQRVKSMIGSIEARVKSLEERQPEKGEPGEKGAPGESPVVIIDDVVDKLVSDAEFKAMVSESVAKQYAKSPPAPGADGKDGEKGADGSDGVGVAGGMIDKSGNLILTTSNGETHNLGRVEGKDGLGFEDASATWDKEAQEIVMRYAHGDVFKEVRYPAPAPVHAGFWQAGMKARCGSFVTHNGSLWYANKDTSEEPTYQSSDWQLSARKGADGQHKTVKVARD